MGKQVSVATKPKATAPQHKAPPEAKHDPIAAPVRRDPLQAAEAGLSSTVATAQRRGADSLPHRGTMERAFGTGFGDVSVHTGAGALASQGVQAATRGSSMVFAEPNPGPKVVAHELTHVMQNRGGSTGALAASTAVSTPNAGAEREARDVSARVVAGERVQVRQAPSARLHLLEYGELGTGAKRKVDAAAYLAWQDRFEVGLGRGLSTHPMAMRGADLMLLRMRKLVDLQGRRYKKRFVEAFGTESKGTTGAIKNTFSSLTKAMRRGNLRVKMGMVYNAIRSGALSEGLKKAFLELDKAEQALAKAKGGRKGVNSRSYKRALKKQQALEGKWGEAIDTGNVMREGKALGMTKATKARGFTDRTDFYKSLSTNHRDNIKSKKQDKITVGEFNNTHDNLSYAELKRLFPDRAPTGQKGAFGKKRSWKNQTQEQKRQTFTQDLEETALPKQYLPFQDKVKVNQESVIGQVANQFKARLVGGISGSTDMYLHAAKHLGLSAKALSYVRLASLGTMLPIRDHSFLEIMLAARAYGVPWGVKKVEANGSLGAGAAFHEGYKDIAPLSQGQIRGLAGVDFPDPAAVTTAMKQEVVDDSRFFKLNKVQQAQVTALVNRKKALHTEPFKSRELWTKRMFDADLRPISSLGTRPDTDLAPYDTLGVPRSLVQNINGNAWKKLEVLRVGLPMTTLHRRAKGDDKAATTDKASKNQAKWEHLQGTKAFKTLASRKSGGTSSGKARMILGQMLVSTYPNAVLSDSLRRAARVSSMQKETHTALDSENKGFRGEGMLARNKIKANRTSYAEITKRLKGAGGMTEGGEVNEGFDQSTVNLKNISMTNIEDVKKTRNLQDFQLGEDHNSKVDEMLQDPKGKRMLGGIYLYSLDVGYKGMNALTNDPEKGGRGNLMLNASSLTAEGLRKLPVYGGTTYRGCNSREVGGLDGATVGKTLSYSKFLSTGKIPIESYIDKFSAVMVIRELKTGRDIMDISKEGDREREVLFPPGASFVTTRVWKQGTHPKPMFKQKLVVEVVEV